MRFVRSLGAAAGTAGAAAMLATSANAQPRRATPVRPAAAPLAPMVLDSVVSAAYRWRNIGPDRGGRSIAVSGVRGRPKEAYFGATGGGLWKTTDGGDTWASVTDGLINSASVGAVAVSESNPDVIYIGTGETCIRGNIMPGDGVYKSTDAGKTWTHVGFMDSHGIAKIRVHPTNPDIAWVASFGKYSEPSSERGIFKTTDGGKTWRKVLYRDDRTGGVDISVDRSNPNVLFAAMWEAYRKEWQMSSGGPGSGLFKSTDGGETWTDITRNPGMPKGMIGRIGVAVTGALGQRVYALVENTDGGLLKSDDGGATWTMVNQSRSIRQRAFYYTHVFADPKNADVVYLQNTSFFRSTDGGKTITTIDNGTHGDFHDLWVDPEDPTHLVVGNDGGGAVSVNTGGRWTAQDFPTEQFYHVVTTKHVPYHVCGSQQDNTTLCTPFNWNASAFGFGGSGRRAGGGGGGATGGDITSGGMSVSYVAGGGEPGYIAPDPKNPDLFYSGTNNGAYLDKFDKRTGLSREVNPYPWFYSGEPSKEIRERWQWTFPIVFSPANPNVLFVSSQRLWKTTDGGQTWAAISGDLTRHAPETQEKSGGPITGDMNGPEVYATIFAVGPGKRNVNVIWTGSDDGLVHVTRDGGKTWTNVTPPGMPDFGRVSQIDASAFADGAAYVSVRRPLLGDFAPYIFKTSDFGKTWTRITTGLAADAYVHAVREDPTRPGLLYAATQRGVSISYDDGATWQSLNLNLPSVPVADLVVEGNELVIGTHGRGFWVLDNIAPLRQITPAIRAGAAHVFTPPTGVRSGPAVTISWWMPSAAKSVAIAIQDSAGRTVRSFDSLTTSAGLRRVTWDLRGQPPVGFSGMILWGARMAGPALPPGTYTAKLTVDGASTTSGAFSIVRHPWIPGITDADLVAQYAFGAKVRDQVTAANNAVVAIRRVKAQVTDRTTKSKDAALASAAEGVTTKASGIEEQVYQVRNQSNQDPLNFPIKVNNRLATLLSMSERGDGRPTNNLDEIFGILRTELAGYTDALAKVWAEDLPKLNAELARLKLPPVDPGCAKAEGCVAVTP
jgi:photosystem II stability/assembly factor-like uncharacterized protein